MHTEQNSQQAKWIEINNFNLLIKTYKMEMHYRRNINIY